MSELLAFDINEIRRILDRVDGIVYANHIEAIEHNQDNNIQTLLTAHAMMEGARFVLDTIRSAFLTVEDRHLGIKTDEDESKTVDYSEVADLLLDGITAFDSTREYVGYDTLPAFDGWSWYDWINKVEEFFVKYEEE